MTETVPKGIETTTTFKKIAALTKPIRIVQGGMRSSKTWSILYLLVLYALKRELTISIVAESYRVVERGALKDFKEILERIGIWDDGNLHKTKLTYQLEKSTFEFLSVDGDPSKFRGSSRSILYVNEGTAISFETFDELENRTELFTFIDYNPSTSFWVHEHLIGRDNVDFIKVNFRDNEFIPIKLKKEIESWEELGKTDKFYANRWRVMGLGELGITEGLILQNWEEIDELPLGAKILGTGLDWGFANDSTAAVSIYSYDGKIIWDETIYETGLLNSQIAKKLKQSKAREAIIVADSSEPKSIAELKAYGLPILPVYKGKDSINYGLSLIQEEKFLVTKQSTNIIKELMNYSWLKDKDDTPMNIPQDKFNNSIDAARYFYLTRMGNKNSKFNFKWK